MSGRLVILPKKSYCPWNPENIKRAERDEQLDRERQKEQERREAEAVSEARLRALKKRARSTQPWCQDDTKCKVYESTNERVNVRQSESNDEGAVKPFRLFSAEEAMANVKSRRPRSEIQNCKLEPFYLKARSCGEEEGNKSSRRSLSDKRRKLEMDPMREYSVADSDEVPHVQHHQRKNDSSFSGAALEISRTLSESTDSESRQSSRRSSRKQRVKQKRRNSEEKRRHDQLTPSTALTKRSRDELRQRRLERERQEQLKVSRLISEQNLDRQSYNDQYNPKLNRKK